MLDIALRHLYRAGMFTGIVEEAGRAERIRKGSKSTELFIRPRKVGRGLRIGNSVAVNGACLTVVGKRNGLLKFDVLDETLRRTNLGKVQLGTLVNLERPLQADGRFDGHIVQGHVDGTGIMRRYERAGTDYVLEVKAPCALMKYVVEKGSIAVDGISLTVAAVGRDWFRVWIIPHTHEITNLAACRAGDQVNLEADILAKYVEKSVGRRRD
ncbi:MAG: riboflavin synthase [Verrucomicrobiia bacterium]|jgi:riboflavin synthase